jgi:alkylated DNA nucleotide flippase Atl1
MRREERAQQLWSLLALAATNRQILTYGLFDKLTGVPARSIGDFLRPIQQFCIENELPAITSIVVQEESGIPGEGFIAAEDVPAAQAEVFQHSWLTTPAPSAEQFADSYARAPDRRGALAKTAERSKRLPITLIPPDPNQFRQQFLRTRLAEIVVTYRDGRVERKQWQGSNFSASSNVMGNLRSRPEFRAGQWQRKNIREVTVRVLDNE